MSWKNLRKKIIKGKNRLIIFQLVRRALVLFFILNVISCNKENAPDCIKSTGDIVRVEREIGYFHSIQLNDNINLLLNKSNKHKLVIEAGKNLLKKITFEITTDSVLVIRNENTCNWVRSYDKPINVYLDFVDLIDLDYRSIGDVTSLNTLTLDSLDIDVWEGAGTIKLDLDISLCRSSLHYGTADIKLSGVAGLCVVYSSGLGLIDNRNLNTGILYINNRSSNDVYIRASSTLGATIENIGNIYYYGNPHSVSLNRIGTGNLIDLE